MINDEIWEEKNWRWRKFLLLMLATLGFPGGKQLTVLWKLPNKETVYRSINVYLKDAFDMLCLAIIWLKQYLVVLSLGFVYHQPAIIARMDFLLSALKNKWKIIMSFLNPHFSLYKTLEYKFKYSSIKSVLYKQSREKIFM